MISQILLGLGFTAATTLVAILFIVALTLLLEHLVELTLTWSIPLREMTILFTAVLWLLLGIVSVVACWAWLFSYLEVFDDYATSFYFAVVATTTVGFGDITLPVDSRILSGFAAADGFIIFGLDTAVLFDVIRRVRESH